MLVSGGIDSAVALAEAIRGRDGVLPVYVRSGLVWEPAEMYWLERLLQTLRGRGGGGAGDPGAPAGLADLTVLDLPVHDLYRDHWSLTGKDPPGAASPDDAVYLPGRNVLLLAKTGIYAAERKCRAIVMGPLAANPFPDSTRAFFDAMGEALGRGMGLPAALPIETPLAGLTKPEVIHRGRDLRLDLTFSCLSPTPDHRHCGRCNKCAERRRGFADADVPDPTEYAAH